MAGEAIAVAAAAAQKRIVRALEAARATSPQHAVAYTPRDRRVDRRVWARMLKHGAVREVGAGRFYLDREGLKAFRSAMRRRMAAIIGLFAAAAGAFVALGG